MPWDVWEDELKEARMIVSKIVNTSVDETSFAGNTSEGLNIIANGVKWNTGDNVS